MIIYKSVKLYSETERADEREEKARTK